MKKESSQFTFYNPNVLTRLILCLASAFLALLGSGGFSAQAQSCSWSSGPDMLSPGVRMVGVYFPTNGKFYAMGGRAFDGGGGELTNPFEFDPATNSWTTKAATYPDGIVN